MRLAGLIFIFSFGLAISVKENLPTARQDNFESLGEREYSVGYGKPRRVISNIKGSESLSDGIDSDDVFGVNKRDVDAGLERKISSESSPSPSDILEGHSCRKYLLVNEAVSMMVTIMNFFKTEIKEITDIQDNFKKEKTPLLNPLEDPHSRHASYALYSAFIGSRINNLQENKRFIKDETFKDLVTSLLYLKNGCDEVSRSLRSAIPDNTPIGFLDSFILNFTKRSSFDESYLTEEERTTIRRSNKNHKAVLIRSLGLLKELTGNQKIKKLVEKYSVLYMLGNLKTDAE
ncbi:hypothetical protein AYI68_g5438 [Smittium mucronatum]|uniref:Uncharacterized protein n=1 Tax=Smittium mucronatum TaxID=133383 RepID=A0A1R0GUE5_9FUNG|nr:hypothetical protein AYI68_g5438 [Smittium mucronatum]